MAHAELYTVETRDVGGRRRETAFEGSEGFKAALAYRDRQGSNGMRARVFRVEGGFQTGRRILIVGVVE